MNIFSNIYAYDSNTGKLQLLMANISNIEARPHKRELFSAEKSGPRFYSTCYQFLHIKPCKSRQTVLMDIDLESATESVANGDVIKRRVNDLIKDAGDKFLPKRRIAVERALLYSKPGEQSKTWAYLVLDDMVEILGVKRARMVNG